MSGRAALAKTIVDVLAGWTGAAEAVLSGVHGIDVLPATRELAGVELALAGEVGRETVLRDALHGLAYDQVVIDTPSNLGLLTVNALVAADLVIAPVAAGDEGAAQGVAELRADARQAHTHPPDRAGAGGDRDQGQAAAGDRRDDRRRDHRSRPSAGRADPRSDRG